MQVVWQHHYRIHVKGMPRMHGAKRCPQGIDSLNE
jgi:hypothetical protein